MTKILAYLNTNKLSDIIKNDTYRKNISVAVFYATFMIYMVASLLQYTSIKSSYPDFHKLLTKIIGYCVYVAIINVILLADYSLSQLLLYTVLMIIMYQSYKHCGTRLVYQSFVLLLSARQVEWDKLRRKILYVWGAFIGVNLILYATGVQIGFEFYKDDRLRVILGYNHPNVLGCVVMTFGLIWIANFTNRQKIWDYLVIIALMAFCWFGPMSRTAAITLGLGLILMLVKRFWGDKLINNTFVKWIFALYAPFYFLVIFGLSYIYNPDNWFLNKINSALSGRVAFGHAFLQKYYHTWMGQKIKMISNADSEKTGEANMYLDSAYMRLYVSIGIIALLIFLCVMTAAMLYAIKKQDWGLMIALMGYGIYGISEVYMMYVFYNVFVIGAAYFDYEDVKLLLPKRKRNENV